MNARFTHVLSARQAGLIVLLFVSALTHTGYGQSKSEMPSQKLEAGEYFFAGKPVYSENSIDVYAGGID